MRSVRISSRTGMPGAWSQPCLCREHAANKRHLPLPAHRQISILLLCFAPPHGGAFFVMGVFQSGSLIISTKISVRTSAAAKATSSSANPSATVATVVPMMACRLKSSGSGT